MLFNSLTFIVFFSVVVLLHYSIKNWKIQKTVLLLASYLFYAAWNPPFVILLWISTIIDWFAAKKIERSRSRGNKGIWLGISLVSNLGLLGFFKYGNFFLDTLTASLSGIGLQVTWAKMDIILPVGISFYTFQTLSYSIDIYRGNLKTSKSFLDFALYVTFFPQLVAGPIVRAIDFLPQIFTPEQFKNIFAEHMNKTLEKAKNNISKIQKHGGKIILVRYPSTEKVRELENKFAPRVAFWDRIVNETGADRSFHFEDHPTLSGYNCPEWSHLNAEDATKFTKALVDLIKTN